MKAKEIGYLELPRFPVRMIRNGRTTAVWQFMRDNWLWNQLFKDYDDIVDQCCRAWDGIIDQPRKVMSIGPRQRAHRS